MEDFDEFIEGGRFVCSSENMSHGYIDTILLKGFKSDVLRLSCMKDFKETRLRLRGGLFNQNRPWLPDD
jgi:hypothetical protein